MQPAAADGAGDVNARTGINFNLDIIETISLNTPPGLKFIRK
jgi:hypothetical protein